MVIDFRVRPPVKSFLGLSIYKEGVLEKVLYKNAAKLLGLPE